MEVIAFIILLIFISGVGATIQKTNKLLEEQNKLLENILQEGK